MNNMNFSHPARSSKRIAITAAASICLVAIGAAAWVGIGQPSVSSTDTADGSSSESVSRPSYFYEPTDGAMDDYEQPTPPSSSTPQQSESHSDKNTAVPTVTPTAGFFVMPLTGEIIKDFSDSELQYSLTYNDWRLHTAIDIKGVTGDNVNAAGDGTVTAVYEDKLYGLSVEINHGNDIVATYSGLETVVVEVGDVVAVNMPIATLGKVPCESVETTHLHFSVKKSDTPIPPLNIIGM